MSMSVKVSTLAPVTPLESPSADSAQASATPFKDVLSGAIQEVESSQANANQSVQKFLSGEGDDLHSTILATQRADLEFQMFLQVRNKVVSAYQEIMKMQM